MNNIYKYSEIYFTEEQRFRQWWLWAIVIIPCAIPWAGFIIQVIMGYEFGNNPAPDWIVILFWLLFGIGLPIFFYSTKLITQVKPDGIHLRFFSLHRKFKFYPYDKIEKFEVSTYRPIYEYGGWGIRYGYGGKAYNVYGNKGIQLILKNKKKVLIGSQKSEEFYEAIVKAINQKNQ